jgi:hypothetical protein
LRADIVGSPYNTAILCCLGLKIAESISVEIITILASLARCFGKILEATLDIMRGNADI